MTEAEAKTKWCPFARVCLDYGDGPNLVIGPMNRDFANRSTQNIEEAIETSKCLGSACMAWRWQSIDTGGEHSQGFCGLAGKP